RALGPRGGRCDRGRDLRRTLGARGTGRGLVLPRGPFLGRARPRRGGPRPRIVDTGGAGGDAAAASLRADGLPADGPAPPGGPRGRRRSPDETPLGGSG